MVRVGLPVDVERELNEGAKALLAIAQFILCPLALGDVARQAQKPTPFLLKLVDSNLHREGGAVLAPMTGLESDRFASDGALLQVAGSTPRSRPMSKSPLLFADQFLPAVAQANAGLAVDVENGPIIVKQ